MRMRRIGPDRTGAKGARGASLDRVALARSRLQKAESGQWRELLEEALYVALPGPLFVRQLLAAFGIVLLPRQLQPCERALRHGPR